MVTVHVIGVYAIDAVLDGHGLDPSSAGGSIRELYLRMVSVDEHTDPPRRLLVVMPTWLGDTVMATPTLRALRGLYPEAHITGLCRRNVRPILDGCPWVDRVVTVRGGKREVEKNGRGGGAGGRSVGGARESRLPRSGRSSRNGPFRLARRLGQARFNSAVLLPNSFRTALLARMAGIPRRVGYDRDGRGFLLTDLLLPRRERGRFVPVSTRDYYLGIACYLGAVDPDPRMELFTREDDDLCADRLLEQGGYMSGDDRPLVLINPGANFGDAKLWYAERFAAVADRCVRELGAVVCVSGSPAEAGIIGRVLEAAQEPMINLPALGVDLTTLKSVLKRSSLMVTNDTGPRHMAAALGVPVVTVFGPTDPVWSDTGYARERSVRVDVFCGPCQKKRCPLDHRCMTRIEPGMVFEQVRELLAGLKNGSAAAR